MEGTHEQVHIYVGTSQEMVGIICEMVSWLATRPLDGREIQTHWPGYSGIALAVGRCPWFSMKSTMYHIKRIMQHIMHNDLVLSYEHTRLNPCWDCFFACLYTCS